MPTRDIVVIGASTGGINALQTLVGGLSPNLNAVILVVLHVGVSSPDILDRMLAKAGSLSASNARNDEIAKAGHIYVAPADHHLLIGESGKLQLSKGPKENRFRPSIDVLFRSAALAFGPRVIGVVLSGCLDDGTAGLWTIKSRGGVAVVQEPSDAVADEMPRNALAKVVVDHTAPAARIGEILSQLSATPGINEEPTPVPDILLTEVKIAAGEEPLSSGVLGVGDPSLYSCPECGGVLLQIAEAHTLRFRCHTGHAYSVDSLLAEYTETSEALLWRALRSLKEHGILLDGLMKGSPAPPEP